MTMAGEGGLNVVQSLTQRKKSEQVGCELSMNMQQRAHTLAPVNMYLAPVMCSHTYMHTLLGLEVQ